MKRLYIVQVVPIAAPNRTTNHVVRRDNYRFPIPINYQVQILNRTHGWASSVLQFPRGCYRGIVANPLFV